MKKILEKVLGSVIVLALGVGVSSLGVFMIVLGLNTMIDAGEAQFWPIVVMIAGLPLTTGIVYACIGVIGVVFEY